jgi:hypothetical protein
MPPITRSFHKVNGSSDPEVQIFGIPKAWRIGALIAIPGLPLLIHQVMNWMGEVFTINPAISIPFLILEVGCGIGMISLYIASLQTLLVTKESIQFRTVYRTKTIEWSDVASYDVNAYTGDVDITSAHGVHMHLTNNFFRGKNLEVVIDDLKVTREHAFSTADEHGLRCGPKSGAAAIVLALFIACLLPATLLFVWFSNPPQDGTGKLEFGSIIGASFILSPYFLFLVDVTFTANAEGICRKNLLGTRCLSFATISQIELYLKATNTKSGTIYTEVMRLSGSQGNLRVTSAQENYMLLRDYILHHSPQARVIDRRPEGWILS